MPFCHYQRILSIFYLPFLAASFSHRLIEKGDIKFLPFLTHSLSKSLKGLETISSSLKKIQKNILLEEETQSIFQKLQSIIFKKSGTFFFLRELKKNV
jgi:hypothetical protein